MEEMGNEFGTLYQKLLMEQALIKQTVSIGDLRTMLEQLLEAVNRLQECTEELRQEISPEQTVTKPLRM